MNARKIFESLGYKKARDENNIYYTKHIYEDVIKTIRFDFEKRKAFVRFSHNQSFGIRPELSYAIYMQSKELGWLNKGDESYEE